LLAIIAIQVTIAQPQIMLFGVFWCYAGSGPVRLSMRLSKLGLAKMRKHTPDTPGATRLGNVHPLPTLDRDKEGSL
jgi:hypothetical protein